MSDKVMYLMRGLPTCGKSHTARRLAEPGGVVLETDEYFLTQVGADPTQYDYRAKLLPEARRWNFERFVTTVAAGASPIIIDCGNGLKVAECSGSRESTGRLSRYSALQIVTRFRTNMREYSPHALAKERDFQAGTRGIRMTAD